MPGYQDELLVLAKDLADRLMPAFETSKTGIPWPRVHLMKGVMPFETNNTCLAGAGTLLLEFGVLSRLTGDKKYERAARKALKELWNMKSQLNLVGTSLDMEAAKWLAPTASIGAGADSFYEVT